MIWNTIWIENTDERDALWIAEMSRELVEERLEWSWTPERVLRSVKASNVVVIKATIRMHRVGFGIMSYRKEKANLNLLAVDPKFQSLGVASKILRFLEEKAFGQGIQDFYVQVRETNVKAQMFYKKFGYVMIDRNERYYQQKEAGVIYYKYCSS